MITSQGSRALASRLAFLLFAALWAAAPAFPCPSVAECMKQGVEAFVQEEYKDASKAFEEAVAKNPNDADALVWLGRADGRRAERSTGLKRLGAFSLARQVRDTFERAITIDPKNLPGLESLLTYYIEAPGIVGGGVDKAVPLAERVFAISPARGWRARAMIHQKREEWDQAEAALRKAVALEPDDIGHLLSLASYLARRGWHEPSDRLFAQAIARAPDSPQVWFARGKALVRAERNPAEARRLLERYLKTPLYAPDADPYSDARKLLAEL